MRMSRRTKWMFVIIFAPLGILLFVTIGGEVVKHLWNWLLPSIFGWRQITFWQAIGLLALCRILFGGFGFHNSDRSSFRRRMGQRWEGMTPEERERFQEAMRGRCGFGPSASDVKGL